jgi:putative addiction module component (TIGR02574 family)
MSVLSAPDPMALREQALRLPETDRAELVTALLDSLRPPASPSSAKALGNDLVRRADAHQRGELPAVDFDESIGIAREALSRKRSS